MPREVHVTWGERAAYDVREVPTRLVLHSGDAVSVQVWLKLHGYSKLPGNSWQVGPIGYYEVKHA